MFKSPCYDKSTEKDCKDRCCGCACDCIRWKKYIEKRDKVYKERLEIAKIYSY